MTTKQRTLQYFQCCALTPFTLKSKVNRKSYKQTSPDDLQRHCSTLNKTELWRGISKDHQNQWLITKSSFAENFLARQFI